MKAALHGLNTSTPSSRRQTQELRLPVGSSAGLSFTVHGKDNSRPNVRHNRTVLTLVQRLSSSWRMAPRRL